MESILQRTCRQQGDAVFSAARLAVVLQSSEVRVRNALELLSGEGFFVAEDYLECPDCDNLCRTTDVATASSEGRELECSQCETALAERDCRLVKRYRPGPRLAGLAGSRKQSRRSTLRVFYSYSHADEHLREELQKHLSTLRREDFIDDWYDGKLSPGAEFRPEIINHLQEADIVLLLISSDFLASDFCWCEEMQRAIELHHEGAAQVVPIILRDCDWHTAPFGKLLALPKDGKPAAEFENLDVPFAYVAKRLRELMEERID